MFIFNIRIKHKNMRISGSESNNNIFIESEISMSYPLFYRYGCCIPELLSNFLYITWALSDEAYIQSRYGSKAYVLSTK